MPRILNRLPVPTRDDLAFVGQERVRLRAYEIIVWVSLQPERTTTCNPRAPRFPAILDTAHTHNFAIREDHLVRWSGMRREDLRPIGNLRHLGKHVPLHASDVWLYRNVPRQRDQLLDEPPY